MMKKFIFIFTFFIVSFANIKNAFIIDYFDYNETPRVIGFSCSTTEGNKKSTIFIFALM